MINDLILKDTTKEEWQQIRARLKARILQNLGESPVALEPAKADFQEIERYEEYGLTHIKIKYRVFADEWSYAIIILPANINERGCAKAVLAIHGTNDMGKFSMMSPDKAPRRVYALELAERGYVTFSPDQFGFGEAMKNAQEKEKYENFYKYYPKWSITGYRVLAHIRALDVLDSLDYVIHDGYGVIGNSLGGQAAFYLTGMDERIKAAFVSTGISPHASNAYRIVHKQNSIHPYEAKMLEANGKSPWELNELMGLCAPRAVLFSEPFNDPYNPFIQPVIDCVKSAHKVYSLLGEPEKLALYIHGDGHDTVTEVHNFGYSWLEKFLK